ncbi:hypothetical protein [Metabacillus litoralis]|uniref:hypothetical protein n=1 Tax=Metabacillus litoralis TaxID=152268 RepID=UPI00203C75CD|nr:hypothetical protein [Metabacillus litoralis]MCM3654098.1 hypothetical protein [Metabacillus litoralis]
MENKEKPQKEKSQKQYKSGFTLKDTITTIIIPIVVTVITVFVAGHYQMKSINKTNEAQIEAAIKTADAQIKAAEISKVNEIEYDYKETNNWDVKESIEYMPLKKGNYWLYSGSFTSYSMKQEEYFTKNVNVKFEIKEEIKNEGLSLFIVSNFPLDMYHKIRNTFDEMEEAELSSSEPIEFVNRENNAGLFLVANKLFFIPENQLDSIVKFVKEPNKVVDQQLTIPSLSYEDLIFEFPMFKGQRFGHFNYITRADLSYFWYVNNVREIESLNGDTFERVQIFDLIFNTLSGQDKIAFRPYLGILFYSSKHSGATDDLYLELKEFEFK